MSLPELDPHLTHLNASDFDVSYERISYESLPPVWCAKAVRGGTEWRAFGNDLPAAFRELATLLENRGLLTVTEPSRSEAPSGV